MSSITNLTKKTLGYLRDNGVIPTAKKLMRRVLGNNLFPSDEDALYQTGVYTVPPQDRWEMPAVCVPYTGRISVIVPTYQGIRELPDLMEALHSQTGIPDMEIVVVDSGSTDGTAAYAQQQGATVLSITQEEFSHSYARMLGAQRATGEYLLFMTQDAVPDRPDWMLRMLQPCLCSGAAAVSCAETPKPDGDLLSRVSLWSWNRLMTDGSDRLSALPDDTSYLSLRRSAQLTDNACLVRRAVFLELGGHRGTYAEDLDLGIRLLNAGYRVGSLHSVSVIHSHNRSPLYHFKRAIVDAVTLSRLFDDFSLEPFTTQDAMNRIFTGVCACRMYLYALDSFPKDTVSAEEFAEWTRKTMNDVLMKLKHMRRQAVESMLLSEDEPYDATVRSFIAPLWSRFSADYKYAPGLTATLGRNIMHTVCEYWRLGGQSVDEASRTQLRSYVWQYFAQSAGLAIGAASLNPNNHDDRLNELVQQYSTGV